MPKSRLSCKTIASPNHYNGRAYPVSRITVHHMAGNLTVEQCGAVFASSARQASSNYGIGSDGRIACYVDESDAAWTSSSWDNDNRAVTIEVADANTANWSCSDAAWRALVALCADICDRYGFRLTFTGDTRGSLTAHRWFAATSCPGDWLYARFPQLCREVNAILDGDEKEAEVITAEDLNNIARHVNSYVYGDDSKINLNAYNAQHWGYWYSRETCERVQALEEKLDKLIAKLGA